MNSLRLQVLILAAVATIALAACGDKEKSSTTAESATTTAKAASVEACELVTTSEAATVLGGPVGEPKTGTVGSFEQRSSSCTYALANDSLTSMIVTVLHGHGQVDLFNTQKASVGTAAGYERVVPNLGEAAGCTKELLGAATLEVLKGQQVLQIVGAPCDKLIPVASAAIGRL